LEQLGFQWPPVNDVMVNRYLDSINLFEEKKYGEKTKNIF